MVKTSFSLLNDEVFRGKWHYNFICTDYSVDYSFTYHSKVTRVSSHIFVVFWL